MCLNASVQIMAQFHRANVALQLSCWAKMSRIPAAEGTCDMVYLAGNLILVSTNFCLAWAWWFTEETESTASVAPCNCLMEVTFSREKRLGALALSKRSSIKLFPGLNFTEQLSRKWYGSNISAKQKSRWEPVTNNTHYIFVIECIVRMLHDAAFTCLP